jgi:hypothetical protein
MGILKIPNYKGTGQWSQWIMDFDGQTQAKENSYDLHIKVAYANLE